MKCVILCAGYGTRLYPLTFETPKALIEIKGKPIIEHIIEKIPLEIDIFIVTHENFYLKFIWWLENYKKSHEVEREIEIINDHTTTIETRLGAIGDFWFVIKEKNMQDDILVIAGDNLFDFNLKEFINFFKKEKKTLAGVYDIDNLEEVKKLSVVEVKDDKVISFEEKPSKPESTLVSVAIYIFTKEDLQKIEEYMKTNKPKDGVGFLIQDFCKKQDVYAFVFKGKWHDIGSHETYNFVKENW